jgi:hypothetical protein
MSVYCDSTDLLYSEVGSSDFEFLRLAATFWFKDTSQDTGVNRTLFYPRSRPPASDYWVKFTLDNRRPKALRTGVSDLGDTLPTSAQYPEQWYFVICTNMSYGEGPFGTVSEHASMRMIAGHGYSYDDESYVSSAEKDPTSNMRLGFGNDTGSYDDPALGVIADIKIYSGIRYYAQHLVPNMHFWEPQVTEGLWDHIPLINTSGPDARMHNNGTADLEWQSNGTPDYSYSDTPPIKVSPKNRIYFLPSAAPSTPTPPGPWVHKHRQRTYFRAA